GQVRGLAVFAVGVVGGKAAVGDGQHHRQLAQAAHAAVVHLLHRVGVPGEYRATHAGGVAVEARSRNGRPVPREHRAARTDGAVVDEAAAGDGGVAVRVDRAAAADVAQLRDGLGGVLVFEAAVADLQRSVGVDGAAVLGAVVVEPDALYGQRLPG